MRCWSRRWGFLLLVLCLPLPLSASLISYTMAGNITGTLGASTLTNVPFTFVFNGDTTGVHALDPPANTVLENPAISNTISITGFGSGQFTQSILVLAAPGTGGVAFADTSLNSGISMFNPPGFVGWDLATPIGPFGASNATWVSGSFTTTLGTLAITGAQSLTFQATAAIPEPATAALIGAGLLLLGMLRRK